MRLDFWLYILQHAQSPILLLLQYSCSMLFEVLIPLFQRLDVISVGSCWGWYDLLVKPIDFIDALYIEHFFIKRFLLAAHLHLLDTSTSPAKIIYASIVAVGHGVVLLHHLGCRSLNTKRCNREGYMQLAPWRSLKRNLSSGWTWFRLKLFSNI